MADWPDKWTDLPMAVIDVETTGLEPEEDRIIEIGIIHFEDGDVVDRYGQLVDPECPLPDKATEITGITEDDLEGQPTFDEIAEKVHSQLDGKGIVAYNLEFDRGFVKAELERCGLEWPSESPTIDPLVFARQFFQNKRSKNLGAIADHLDIPLEEAHRATHDAEVAGHILFEFEDKLPESLDELLVLQAQWESAQARQRRKWRGDDEQASETMTSALGEKTIGLGPAYIYGDEMDPLRALYMSVPEASN